MTNITYPLLISGTQFKGVLDSLLVLPVADVDEADHVLVPVPQLPLHAGRARHGVGARSPGRRLVADDQQSVTQNHVAIL